MMPPDRPEMPGPTPCREGYILSRANITQQIKPCVMGLGASGRLHVCVHFS